MSDTRDPTPRELLEALEGLEPERLVEAGFDAEKVKRIRASLRDGTFRSDAEKIADGLLRAARDKLRKP